MPDWRRERLGDHAQINARIGWRGLSADEYVESGPFLIAGKHIVAGSVDWDACDHLTEDRYRESPEIALRNGDVIISKDGTIGRVARIDSLPGPATLNGTMMLVRPIGSLDYRYLSHLLNGLAFKKLVEERISGSSVPHLFQRDLVILRVSMPPLEEQRRIAEILDAIDEAIQATERVIAKLWSEQVGAMDEQLAAIDEQYPHRSLLDVVSLRSGQVDPRVEPYASCILVAPDHILGGGRGRLNARVSAKTQGAISGKYQFEAGNVVYSKIRPELRKGWLATFDGLCSADMYPLAPAPGLLGGYLALVILGQRFSRFAASVSGRSSGMPKVNRRELAEFRIALPPLEVQQAIASLAESYEGRIDAETASLHKTIEVRRGLAADLLSGRVRTVAA